MPRRSHKPLKPSERRANNLQAPNAYKVKSGNLTGTIPASVLGSGTANSSVFLRGDNVWAAVPAGTATYAHSHSTGDITSGIFDTARLGSGTATSTTYLRGDGVWATVAASGDGSHSSHQTLLDLQGGTTGEYYHFTSAQWAGLVAAGWASSTHSHSYLPLAGGTLTGTLVVQIAGAAAAVILKGDTGQNTRVDFEENGVRRGRVIWDADQGVFMGIALDTSGSAGQSHWRATYDGPFQAQFGSDVKLETTSGGVVVTGVVNASTDFQRGGTSLGAIYASATHVHSAGAVTDGVFARDRLGSGSYSTSAFLRGDGTWQPITSSGGSEYVTQVPTATGTVGAYITFQKMAEDSANLSDVSGVVVMSSLGVGTGVWAAKYIVLYLASAAGQGFGVYLNHTGTVTTFTSIVQYVTTGTTAVSGVHDQTVAAAQLVEGKAERVINTFSSVTTGVDTASGTMMMTVDAMFVVTASGNLHLKARAETAGDTVRVLTNTNLQLAKIS